MTAVNNNASPMDGAPVIDFDKFKPTRSFTAARKRKDLAMRVLIALAFIVALIPLFSVLLTTIVNGVKRLNLNFLSYNMTGVVGGNPTPSGGYGGIQHAIIGTLEITFGAMVISIPIGLMCAVYLVEYSNRGKLARVITLLVDVMSGIPESSLDRADSFLSSQRHEADADRLSFQQPCSWRRCQDYRLYAARYFWYVDRFRLIGRQCDIRKCVPTRRSVRRILQEPL